MAPERSLTELATDVAYQAGDLIRNEIRLARAEAIENVRGMGDALLRAALGVAFAGSAVTLGMLGLAYLLGLVMPMWGAALISAAIAGVTANIFLRGGLKALSAEKIDLPKTSRQVARDINLIKETVT